MSDITNSELADVLHGGAQFVCQYALDNWTRGEYGGDDDLITRNVHKWTTIRDRIPSKSQLEELLNEWEAASK